MDNAVNAYYYWDSPLAKLTGIDFWNINPENDDVLVGKDCLLLIRLVRPYNGRIHALPNPTFN